MSETPEGSPVVIAVRDQDTDERLVYETGLTGWWDIEAGQFVIPFTTRENASDCLKIIAASNAHEIPAMLAESVARWEQAMNAPEKKDAE